MPTSIIMDLIMFLFSLNLLSLQHVDGSFTLNTPPCDTTLLAQWAVRFLQKVLFPLDMRRHQRNRKDSFRGLSMAFARGGTKIMSVQPAQNGHPARSPSLFGKLFF